MLVFIRESKRGICMAYSTASRGSGGDPEPSE